MKPKIFASARKPRSSNWCNALARCEDGTIRVVEHLSAGFYEVGASQVFDKKGNVKRLESERLFKGQRRLILQDLYIACCLELKIDWNPDDVKWRPWKTD
jgi:hypothetical protein